MKLTNVEIDRVAAAIIAYYALQEELNRLREAKAKRKRRKS